MKIPSTFAVAALVLLTGSPSLAQRRPNERPNVINPPVVPNVVPNDTARGANLGGNVVAPQGQAQAQGQTARKGSASCEEVRRKAKFGIYFDKVEIEKLVQTVSDATCRTFILPENIRGKISIIGPENGRVEVDSDQFYQAFLAALDSNGLSVYPHGRFLKIVDKNRAKQTTIPTYVDETEPYTTNEQMITRLFKVKYSDIEPLRGVLQQLVTKDGDTIPYQPDTIIVNDIGSNMHRLEKIVDQLDRSPSSDQIRVLQIKYATAQEIADKVTKLFEQKNQRPGQRGGVINPSQPPSAVQPQGVAEAGAATGGPATLSQLIPDERTNKLIIIASPAAMDRIQQLIDEIDIPISGEGRVNVYYLENAAAEDIANTLSSLAQGSANRPKAPPPPPGQKAPVQAAELFSGEVKISADKSTNSLVIVASQSDYRNLVRVIEKLDIPRRQVFVEAVIMEVNLDRNTEFGINLHSGYVLNSPVPGLEGKMPGVLGTKYTKSGLPPSFSVLNLANFGGFLAGLQGPAIPGVKELLGADIPAFGIVMHAMQQSSDVNVLSTPHILTSDNEEAEITVGQNVPFQAGFSPSNLGLGGLTGGAAGGALGGLGGLGALGGLGSMFAPINRQNVELKLSVKPQINESDYIRMVISEQTEEIASQDPVLGPTTAKRSAKTTVVARDQETIVLGGIMQDRVIEGVTKVPVLGDLPILGHLFREQTAKKVKTNLLLFLTPYIIKEQADFRRIFERKMAERQAFVEQFYGAVPSYEVTVDFARKAGPFAKLNQLILKEENKLEHGGPGEGGERLITPKTDTGATNTETKTDAATGTGDTGTGSTVKEPAEERIQTVPSTNENQIQ